MPTHITIIRAIDRDPTRCLITLTLDEPDHPGCALHNAPPSPPAYCLRQSAGASTIYLTYRQAAQLGFWLKPGQYIELTGETRDNILHITELHLLDHADPTPPPFPIHPRARELFGLPPRYVTPRNDGTNLEYVILVPILFVVLLLILLLILKYCQ